MAQIDLGRLRFAWQGAWDNATAYELNDVVTNSNVIYVGIATSIPAGTLTTNTSYWAAMLDTSTFATDSDITTAVNNLVDSAPGALDTLNELAAALGDDASFSTTVTNSLAGKQDIVSGVSDTEIGYLDGVTSGIQGQLDTKQDIVANVSDTEIGYLDGVTSSIQTQLNAKAPLLADFVTDATTSRTITSSDAHKTILFTSGSDITITVDGSTDFPVGARMDFIQDGAGIITVTASTATIAAAETSTTSGSFTIGAQYSAATLLCVGTDSYRLIGNITAV